MLKAVIATPEPLTQAEKEFPAKERKQKIAAVGEAIKLLEAATPQPKLRAILLAK